MVIWSDSFQFSFCQSGGVMFPLLEDMHLMETLLKDDYAALFVESSALKYLSMSYSSRYQSKLYLIKLSQI